MEHKTEENDMEMEQTEQIQTESNQPQKMGPLMEFQIRHEVRPGGKYAETPLHNHHAWMRVIWEMVNALQDDAILTTLDIQGIEALVYETSNEIILREQEMATNEEIREKVMPWNEMAIQRGVDASDTKQFEEFMEKVSSTGSSYNDDIEWKVD